MMSGVAVRNVIAIDEEKCDGCGECIPNCAEGALAIVDGKAKLVSDIYCDGMGACLGHCPQGAISMEERPAKEFDGAAAGLRLAGMAPLTDGRGSKHSERLPIPFSGCPGARTIDMPDRRAMPGPAAGRQESELTQWPVKINLVSPMAPYFRNAHLLIAADCVPFAYGAFHSHFLKGRAVVIGCPKFDDPGAYLWKLAAIIQNNAIQSVTVLHMEVPCCFGLAQAAKQALLSTAKEIPFTVRIVGVNGQVD